MARTTRKKVKLDELVASTDPAAPLDGPAFLAAARALLTKLEADLVARSAASPAVTKALRAQHQRERDEQRTAEPYEGWVGSLATQVGAAWILSCVFVRTLEDRGLVRQARIAGPGALDSQRLFFQLAPSLTERDYLLMVFRELARHPAARDLFDAEHSLVWRLSPSAEAAKELLALFRTPGAEAPAFRFGQPSTRFLGDLYQDLSETARKRYALLQTPDFIASFILDRTLEPAIQRFGLDDTTLIDPTCGSGHFLLDAYDRLFEHRLRAEPGIDRRIAATRALYAIYGADINPYAVAIARFRLTLSFLEKAGYSKLADAAAPPLHLVVADSLLHNPQQRQTDLEHQPGQARADWRKGPMFAVEDEDTAREILHRRYAAVVGNPPYITEKDAARREVYRRMYRSAAGKYALSAPFCERLFQLARDRGYVGQITANSFMKREFGKKLIEEVLPEVNLELIVNTSGAYIPGHGTPTVLLFGTNEPSRGDDVLAVLAKRGEPVTPADPAHGVVWSSISGHWSELGFENEYVSVACIGRTDLRRHPWALGGGGAVELKAQLEDAAEQSLADRCDSIGIASFTLEDEVYLRPFAAWRRVQSPPERIRPMVVGEAIRDWSVAEIPGAFFPYTSTFEPIESGSVELRLLWPFRTALANNKLFGGKTKIAGGLTWFEYGRLTSEKLRTPLSIAFAEVATHNHFVLDRGGKVFKQTAPIIKLPGSATEGEHLALAAYLNSSTACFAVRQVCQNKGGQGVNEGFKSEAWEQFIQRSGRALGGIPVPPRWRELASLGREADALARSLVEDYSPAQHARLVAIQEQIDWHVYQQFGLIEAVPDLPSHIAPGSRAFEWLLQRDNPSTEWFERNRYQRPAGDPPAHLLSLIESNAYLRLIEQPEYKYRWTIRDVAAEAKAREREEALDVVECELAAATEPRRLPGGVAPELVASEAVPFLAPLRFNDEGLAKHAAWHACWDAQRAEDAGETVKIDPPPKYGRDDYATVDCWRLRGPLDVPKERFISYPGCASDEDQQPIYGWAGWDHLQRARALAALYLKRKDGEAWTKERLTPMLAGLLELIPWVKQWHNEPSDEYGGLRMGEYFEQFLEGECRQLGLTHEALRAWRPPKKTRAAAAQKAARTRATKKKPAPTDDTDHEAEPST